MSYLKIKNLKKSYGNKVIIPNLELNLEEGAFLALLGPSGCGKTTLLRIVAGLETADNGEIEVDGETVLNPSTFTPPEERKFGMVFQSYAVWPHMTVEENILYPLKIQKLDSAKDQKDKAHEVLSLVHLEDYKGRYPHQLSGGQQQRVALARGLVAAPKILLLDEPLSNLDAKLRAEMRREIRDLHRKLGITILYVTHDQREAFEMSTEVMVMHEGEIAQQGAPDAIKNSPNPGFVTEFLSEF